MWIGVISLFPEMFQAVTDSGITRRAVKNGLLALEYWNPRDYVEGHSESNFRRVDDRPYGGGPGMVMLIEPLRCAITAAKEAARAKGLTPNVIYLSPQGRVLNQAGVQELATTEAMILLCGRYEGVDERLIQREVDAEWSIGDYVLSGGELPAMVLIDAMTRLLPGALGSEASAEEDSFSDGLLDCPHYTRPEVYEADEVPAVLLSGDHAAIRKWRRKQSLARTLQRRPDLLEKVTLDKEQIKLLDDIRRESGEGE
ncbi:MAG: tRNA (guanosine(37)-N1)-methyltransferase TrmD [Moraxellaceae bacterium]|nr:tRNA (guanosine(37)-N1)-methyltransferase TrmD [Moraxellaceae bacterium]MBP7228926.1 tRNA (guanosine(37)-N1)-methyltransferase TrmD [Moraxellaceae bacterium]MBP8851529.1 tRNA (guanosine(37)-N1)-methyltransferase TrmD [Moraxellaceae bacterium]MBP9045087.1 tRNA (guanosine(37)-N1)-methyltransferase TrmD [Moraxellaceae bacterium]MBP9729923.1 tRNA (guanosine(37)-N1)-methyltransferase TrmD [Moraxellaceae bacterium]